MLYVIGQVTQELSKDESLTTFSNHKLIGPKVPAF